MQRRCCARTHRVHAGRGAQAGGGCAAGPAVVRAGRRPVSTRSWRRWMPPLRRGQSCGRCCRAARHGKSDFGPVPLTADHDVSAFDCGEAVLNDWLRHRALKNESRFSRTYVVCAGNVVVGYFCISAGSVQREAGPRQSAPQCAGCYSGIGHRALGGQPGRRGAGLGRGHAGRRAAPDRGGIGEHRYGGRCWCRLRTRPRDGSTCAAQSSWSTRTEAGHCICR